MGPPRRAQRVVEAENAVGRSQGPGNAAFSFIADRATLGIGSQIEVRGHEVNSWKVALIDQTTGAVVPPDELPQIAAALQQQVDNDFVSVWGVRADISALAPGDAVPPDTWPIKVVDSLVGADGVHLDNQGKPYAQAVNGQKLSIAISHELLEMLVDPWGNRFTLAADVDPNFPGRQVFYLVEVCDPCEVSSYVIDGVQLSDFILPSFYDPNAKRPVDFLNTLAGPLPQKVPPKNACL